MDNNQTQQNTDNEDQFGSIKKELQTRFELLPENLKKVITSSDYQMQLFDIAKKHKLTYDKLGQLEIETTMVLIGMTPPDEYKSDVQEQLGLNGNELDLLITDINEAILKPIRENLMALYAKEEVEEGDTINTVKTTTTTTPKIESPYQEPKVVTQAVQENPKIEVKTNSETPPVIKTDLVKSIEEQLKNIRERSSTVNGTPGGTVATPTKQEGPIVVPPAPTAQKIDVFDDKGIRIMPRAKEEIERAREELKIPNQIPVKTLGIIPGTPPVPPIEGVTASQVSPETLKIIEEKETKPSMLNKLGDIFSLPQKPVGSTPLPKNVNQTPIPPTANQDLSQGDPYKEKI